MCYRTLSELILFRRTDNFRNKFQSSPGGEKSEEKSEEKSKETSEERIIGSQKNFERICMSMNMNPRILPNPNFFMVSAALGGLFEWNKETLEYTIRILYIVAFSSAINNRRVR